MRFFTKLSEGWCEVLSVRYRPKDESFMYLNAPAGYIHLTKGAPFPLQPYEQKGAIA